MKSLFTSESVTEGHPDKICDRISDAMLDACLAQDPNSRVAIETAVKDNSVYVFGELTTKATIDSEAITRNAISEIGYTDPEMQFCANNADIRVNISGQSEDIAQGVGKDDTQDIGAGDQGMMFGYATTETSVAMPLPILLAHTITKRLADVRKSGDVPFLRPDGKAQVTIAYDENEVPMAIPTIVVSTQHNPNVTQKTLEEAVIEHVIKPVVPSELLSNTTYHINPAGRFVIGGPVGDSGLTGRKIIVDTYGGMARHGGGCFSGKDPTKVDRSAAYAARQIALSIIAAHLAERCEVQIAYAIGVPEPVSIRVDTFGTGIMPEEEMTNIVMENFDLRPYAIINRLDLRRPIYSPTSAYGHFGRPEFPWEQPIPLQHQKHTIHTAQLKSV